MNENQQKREELSKELMRRYHEQLNKVSQWLDKIWEKKGLVANLFDVEAEDDYRKLDAYKEALTYYQEFEHKEDVDYSGLVQYALDLNDRFEATDKLLDEKADSIIKYLGGGSALVTFGALMSIKADTTMNCITGIVIIIFFIPSLVCALLAVYKAIHVRRPRTAATPPDVKMALGIAEAYKNVNDFRLNALLIYYPITEAGHYRILQKGKLVSAAHRCYLSAMMLVSLPIVGLLLWLIVAAMLHAK
ncbi:hypothetical protein AYO40_00740 [Planctomycetaceae bacterium SCGC AG-212-D15]|nr:hypothetical protein AYO40_00740 [Planctomycetaceae bacterium SCGC AG-212-D15]